MAIIALPGAGGISYGWHDGWPAETSASEHVNAAARNLLALRLSCRPCRNREMPRRGTWRERSCETRDVTYFYEMRRHNRAAALGSGMARLLVTSISSAPVVENNRGAAARKTLGVMSQIMRREAISFIAPRYSRM